MIAKTILTTTLALLLSTAPAWAALYDSNEFLTPFTKSHIESTITKAKEELNLDLTITITDSNSLEGWGSALANTDIENYTQSVLTKETQQHHEGFAFTVVTDRKGNNGFAPAIRYAANEKFTLSQKTVEKLLNSTYRNGYWEEQLFVFLDNLRTEVESQHHTNDIVFLIVLAIIIIIVLIWIFVPSSGKYSGDSGNSFFFIDGGGDGGGFSGGD